MYLPVGAPEAQLNLPLPTQCALPFVSFISKDGVINTCTIRNLQQIYIGSICGADVVPDGGKIHQVLCPGGHGMARKQGDKVEGNKTVT